MPLTASSNFPVLVRRTVRLAVVPTGRLPKERDVALSDAAGSAPSPLSGTVNAPPGWSCQMESDPNLSRLKGDPQFDAFMSALKADWERRRTTL
jgi:hypothetical protein